MQIFNHYFQSPRYCFSSHEIQLLELSSQLLLCRYINIKPQPHSFPFHINYQKGSNIRSSVNCMRKKSSQFKYFISCELCCMVVCWRWFYRVDLCHQADEEDDDDDEWSIREALLAMTLNKPSSSSNSESHRRCCPFRTVHIGSRQKIVLLV